MKTVDKKRLQKKGISKEDKIKKLLIEDPSGHRLFDKAARTKLATFFGDLISIKEEREHKNKAVTLLISSISLCLSLLFVISMFEWKVPVNGSKVNLEARTTNFDDLIEVPQTKQEVKPPQQIQAPKIVEVSDEEIIEDIEVNLDIEMTEDTKIEQVVFDQTEEAMPEEKADEIFTIVEERPSPTGGLKAFYDFVSKNMEYPARARRMGIEGRVFVQFVVEKDGSLTDIQVVKGIGGGCDEEAVRVLSMAPKWNPGKQRGRPVRVRMILPITFKLID